MYISANLRKLFINCSIFCVTLIFSFVLVEGLLRAKNASMQNYDIEMWKYSNTLKKKSDNKILGHEHVPNTEAVLQSVKIRINDLGLRGAALEGGLDTAVDLPNATASASKNNNRASASHQSVSENGNSVNAENNSATQRKRILFLGSSITLGWGVQEEETLTEQIRAMFKKEGLSVDVLNAGIGNYNAERYIERFFTKLQQLQPTDIVIHAFVRDAEPIEFKEGNFFLKHSQLAVTLWSAYNKITQKHGENALIEHYKKCYDPNSESFQRMKAAYHRLAVYAKQKGIKVYFAMTPDIHNLKEYPLNFAHDMMRQIALENGFSYIDLRSAFSDLEPNEIWAMPGDPHPNARGHRLMAEVLFPILR